MMRLDICCSKCVRELRRWNSVQVAIRDDGLYETTCDAGHKTLTKLQQQRFEILFESGANALLDGYPREAVSSFAASLERFYEFASLVLFLHAGHGNRKFDAVWKPLKKYSERQIGAFISLWSNSFGAPPELLVEGKPGKGKNFRNDVVHNGVIPSQEQAISFGQEVLDLLDSQIKQLKSFAEESVQKVVFIKLNEKGKWDSSPTVMSLGTLVSLNVEPTQHDLGSYLSDLVQRRRHMEIAYQYKDQIGHHEVPHWKYPAE